MTIKQLEKLEKLLDHVGDIALRRRARRMIQDLNPRPGDRILSVFIVQFGNKIISVWY